MAWASTTIVLTTTPQKLIGSDTTWAHVRFATLYDPCPFAVVVESTAVPVRIGGSSAPTGTTGAGLPIVIAGGNIQYNLLADSTLWGWTTASTSLVTMQAGRQSGV